MGPGAGSSCPQPACRMEGRAGHVSAIEYLELATSRAFGALLKDQCMKRLDQASMAADVEE